MLAAVCTGHRGSGSAHVATIIATRSQQKEGVARSARLHAVICFVIPSRSCNPENMGMSRTINPWLSARSVQSQPIPVGQSVPSVHGSEAGRLLTGGIPSARFTI